MLQCSYPSFSQNISWMLLDFRLLLTISFLCNIFYFIPSRALVNLVYISQALLQNCCNHAQSFFLFGNCVYRERQSLIFFVTQYCLYYSSLIFPDAAQLFEKVYYFNKNKFSLCLINFSSLSDNSH